MKLKKTIMYFEIKEHLAKGLSYSAISRLTGIDRRTIAACAKNPESDFLAKSLTPSSRGKKLDQYEPQVVSLLKSIPFASTALIHDRLKETEKDFPEISPKTVYSYVMAIRAKYDLPLEQSVREMMMVEELPFGFQAQADFGECVITTVDDKRKKVYFFVLVLSRSRMKYLYFQEKPFTTASTIDAHEAAFTYLKGIPKQIVYDQDKVLLKDENVGELILTHGFREYINEQKFDTFFCRKSDPQTKGRVENSVKYTKQNFLPGRKFRNLEQLQAEAIAWLERTANHNKHAATHLRPMDEWEKELEFLSPYSPLDDLMGIEARIVHKDNSIRYKGVRYSVPSGTYKGEDKTVSVLVHDKDGIVYIRMNNSAAAWTHKMPLDGAKVVVNRNHKRDTSKSIALLRQEAINHFSDKCLATVFFDNLKLLFPRHFRDQVGRILKVVNNYNPDIAIKAMEKCVEMKEFKATAFIEILKFEDTEQRSAIAPTKIIPITKSTEKAGIQPEKRALSSYDQYLKTSNKTKA